LSWVIEYDPAVLKDFKRIDRPDQRFILDSLDSFINNYSRSYAEALIRTGRLKRLLILVVRVGHRRDVCE